MLKINCKNIKKYYGSRLLLDIEDLKVYSGDRIGIVGVNGVGKTSFLRLLMGEMDDFEGEVLIDSSVRLKYVSQLGGPDKNIIGGKYASIFNVESKWDENMSGGEKTRFKLAEAFEDRANLMLVDEPTSNLDLDAIELVTRSFEDYPGTFLLVSHDRNFLDRVCNKILEINSGRFKFYEGNYSNYLKLKDEELRRQEFEFAGYIKERNRLVNARENVKSRSSSTRRTPRRMGNSEARLHRMGGQAAKKTLDNKAGSIQARIDQLEVKERPKEEAIIRIKLLETSQVHGHILAKGKNINKSFDNNVIFEDAEFNIYNGSKIALIGPNGSGKTSLINMILQETNGISLSKNVKIGYFSQSMDILDGDKTILENVMSTSIRTEDFARLLLARLLFRGERVYDKVKVLSGGSESNYHWLR